MARVIPINIIKGISGKYGKDADFYFATNTSSGKIRISRLPKPSHRPPTEKQRKQRSRFAARHAAVAAWLNANKPNELNGPKGTEAYRHVQRLKRQLGLSLMNQVLLKYMDENNVIRLPETKEQRSCKPQKSKKLWEQISFGNIGMVHREEINNRQNRPFLLPQNNETPKKLHLFNCSFAWLTAPPPLCDVLRHNPPSCLIHDLGTTSRIAQGDWDFCLTSNCPKLNCKMIGHKTLRLRDCVN